MSIHPTAIIGKNVALGKDNEIGPHVVIEDGVRIGSNNKIWPGAYISSGTEIGDENQIHMNAVIGHAPQDLSYQGAPTKTIIGNKNTIREFTTIHRGTKEGTATTLGNENFLMAYAHLGHNCQIGNQTILVNGATLGGYCIVEDGAFISGMVVIHQFCRIGKLAIIGGLSAANQDTPPFTISAGRTTIACGINMIGLRRSQIPAPTRNEIKRAYKLLYSSGLNRGHAILEIEKMATTPEVKYFAEFVKQSKRGICPGGTAQETRMSAVTED
ncbi:MAG: acyl-[acyl-carrier-protein]--UDP-N-acetylglucosamine O-acyltransferase [Omnitrophica bacterium RIFCSPHIGHO2_02_FULL_46_11]|nr:MAG: acyl-[acyl-carrier-protein]--UDP-N-acetylglucosamine O-acyltransferase [Omnitrophica bacterium RIFCSPHIGHO2_02_FULL_46_11]OGW85936.1 MAG: acyl-[acyl-carrier-protein]--UDP-N-acetylglucosamine O-acyltransferase [Omnitrophica bacterium RIFCSPLOWO2_01_FULL_45_10b]